MGGGELRGGLFGLGLPAVVVTVVRRWNAFGRLWLGSTSVVDIHTDVCMYIK